MKKKIVFSILLLALLAVVVGCGKKEKDSEKKGVSLGGWELILSDKQANISKEAKEALDSALDEYVGMEFEPVALLGKQVVAGTNYMFLCKGTPVVPKPETSYKIVIVYKNLEGKSSVSNVEDFEIANYTNKDNEYNGENVSGGWNTEYPTEAVILEENYQKIFDETAKKIVGISYSPIAVVGKQVVSGTNYAVVAYGKLSTKDANTGIYMLTLNEDLEGNKKLVSSSYIDLGEFNK